jgi:3-methyladenine DNA glycosylase AlkD
MKVNIEISDLNTLQTLEFLQGIIGELIDDYVDNRETIDELAEDQVFNKTLQLLVSKMDELDEDDAFGTEGWRHRYGFD